MIISNKKPDTSFTLRQILIYLSIGALLFFGSGIVISFKLEMHWIDRITFLFCLGVVFLLCSTVFVAWKSAKTVEADTSGADE